MSVAVCVCVCVCVCRCIWGRWMYKLSYWLQSLHGNQSSLTHTLTHPFPTYVPTHPTICLHTYSLTHLPTHHSFACSLTCYSNVKDLCFLHHHTCGSKHNTLPPTHPPTHPFTYPPTHPPKSLTRSLTYPLVCSPAVVRKGLAYGTSTLVAVNMILSHPFTYPPHHLPTHPFTYPPTHLPTHSPTHPTHSSARSLTCCSTVKDLRMAPAHLWQ